METKTWSANKGDAAVEAKWKDFSKCALLSVTPGNFPGSPQKPENSDGNPMIHCNTWWKTPCCSIRGYFIPSFFNSRYSGHIAMFKSKGQMKTPFCRTP